MDRRRFLVTALAGTLAGPTPAALAAKQATTTIPIITMSADPIGAGLVASLARPTSNVTGVFVPLPDLSAKRLQLLKGAVPELDTVAVLWNSGNSATRSAMTSTEAAARVLGIAIHSVEMRAVTDVDKAFATIAARGAHNSREFANLGGLMSYGFSLEGIYEARISDGAAEPF